jgi:hypothetical protein
VAFTYDLTTNRGKVRLRLADTVSDGHVFTDAEIDYFLTVGGAVNTAVIEGIDVLLVDAARREKAVNLTGTAVNDKGRTEALLKARAIYALEDLPRASVSFGALIPSDEGFIEPTN